MSLNGILKENFIFGRRTRLDSRDDYIEEIIYYLIKFELLINNNGKNSNEIKDGVIKQFFPLLERLDIVYLEKYLRTLKSVYLLKKVELGNKNEQQEDVLYNEFLCKYIYAAVPEIEDDSETLNATFEEEFSFLKDFDLSEEQCSLLGTKMFGYGMPTKKDIELLIKPVDKRIEELFPGIGLQLPGIDFKALSSLLGNHDMNSALGWETIRRQDASRFISFKEGRKDGLVWGIIGAFDYIIDYQVKLGRLDKKPDDRFFYTFKTEVAKLSIDKLKKLAAVLYKIREKKTLEYEASKDETQDNLYQQLLGELNLLSAANGLSNDATTYGGLHK